MAREPFNTTCDIYEGPGSASPLALRGTFPCRLIFEDAITTLGTNCPDIPYYLTIQAIVPTGYWSTQWGIGDFSKADLVAVPSGDPIKYRVLYTDEINWLGQATYFRSYLIESVIVEIKPCGGANGSGQASVGAVVTNSLVITGEGGAVCSGCCFWLVTKFMSGCGGAMATGAAEVVRPSNSVVVACGVSAIAGGEAETVFTPAPPAVIYWEDHFVDFDGTDLVSHTPLVGTFYTTIFGSMRTESDQAVMYIADGNYSTVGFDPAATVCNITYHFAVDVASSDAGDRAHWYYIRWDGADNLFQIHFPWQAGNDASDNWTITKRVAGVDTVVATSVGTLSAGSDYLVEIQDYGTLFRVIVDGETVQVIDSDFNTNTQEAFQFYAENPTLSLPYLDELLIVSL